MKTFFIKETALSQLKHNLLHNAEWYQKDKPWLSEYFGHDSWAAPSRVPLREDINLKMPVSSRQNFDVENATHIYTALQDLTPAQAVEEGFWAYLTHFTCWQYMKERWPPERTIFRAKDPYDRFFIKNKPETRNGIARLWWFGYLTYDENRKDRFELTKYLVSRQDLAHNVLERSLSWNPNVTRGIINVIAEMERKGKPINNRKIYRPLLQHLNNIGGVTLLDTLDTGEIEKILVKRIKQIS
ncbi:DUF6339 family protein [Paenibacillus sepulcri]|uniref:Uncharacterized protein n=1 Tax=Paenibacillus sepulcri TaxID=359917 RepID=A0ABS7BW33_9BACL|nr:hypothetical protein [Paenibacillus sepulcri]